MSSDARAARAWLAACVAVGVSLAVVYTGSYYQDAGLHFLRARWMWAHPWMLVDVWDRPLFTLLYSLPALLPVPGGIAYLVAKLVSVGLGAATAWLTYDLARGYRLERPALVIPLLWLQPGVFLLSAETSPELLFALLLVAVLRFLQQGRLVVGSVATSLLVLVRPEGLVLAALWAWWVLDDRRGRRTAGSRVAIILWLALAPAIWWYLAAEVTQDPLFILHDWPPLWAPLRAVFVGGAIDGTVLRWNEILGAFLALPFLVGTAVSVWRRQLGVPLSAILAVLAAHVVAGGTGVFGRAPVPSAFVCVAPAIAIVTLAGWNTLARGLGRVRPSGARAGPVVATVALLLSAVGDVLYVDGQAEGRDWRAVSDATAWFAAHPQRVSRLMWSIPYTDILFGHDPTENALRFGDRAEVMATLAAAPAGTLVVWDTVVGPASYRVTGGDIERAGYARLLRRGYSLRGRVPPYTRSWPGLAQLGALFGVPPDHAREQEIWLLYRL